MKATVDPDTCTGCELCVDSCPEVFFMDNGVAKAKAVPASAEESCKDTAANCPTEAIKIEG